MTDNNNPISNKVNHSFTCFPVKNYLEYYKAQGKELTAHLCYTLEVKENITSIEQAQNQLSTKKERTKAKVRIEGQFFINNLDTYITPNELSLVDYTCYLVGEETILNVFCSCDEHQMIVVSDELFYKSPTLKAIFDYDEKQEDEDLDRE